MHMYVLYIYVCEHSNSYTGVQRGAAATDSPGGNKEGHPCSVCSAQLKIADPLKQEDYLWAGQYISTLRTIPPKVGRLFTGAVIPSGRVITNVERGAKAREGVHSIGRRILNHFSHFCWPRVHGQAV